MNKTLKIIGLTVGLAVGLTVGPAFGQHRGHGFGHGGHFRGYAHGGHYRPYVPHHNHGYRRKNYAPYIAGAIGLGIVGAIIYDQYGRRCERQIIGYDINGAPIIDTICR